MLAYSAANPTPNPAGQTVASIFAAAFSNAAGSPVGIVITAQTGTTVGVWQYSSDGSAWTDFPTVSTTNALLLSADDGIRFVPSKAFSGTVSLTAFAWDGSGDFTTTADLAHTGIGGSTPFSATTLTATCLVNSAPSQS